MTPTTSAGAAVPHRLESCASKDELAAAHDFVVAQAKTLELPADRAYREKAVWADFCQALVNSKEFLFIP
ncbi:MAG: hypothetical protein QM811_11705 [Pirellulales bacterium]